MVIDELYKKASLIFDVGAHVGSETQEYVAYGIKTVAIEPQTWGVNYLKENYGSNPLVTIVHAAASNREGTLKLNTCEQSPIISALDLEWMPKGRFSRNYVWNKTEEVRATTLDALIAEHGMPDFCKIDVEGYELRVIQGLSKPISVVSFEFTIEFIDSIEEIAKELFRLGDYEYNFCICKDNCAVLDSFGSIGDVRAEIEKRSNIFPNIWGNVYARLKQ
jgi:FkbM family methyltransferase